MTKFCTYKIGNTLSCHHPKWEDDIFCKCPIVSGLKIWPFFPPKQVFLPNQDKDSSRQATSDWLIQTVDNLTPRHQDTSYTDQTLFKDCNDPGICDNYFQLFDHLWLSGCFYQQYNNSMIQQ